MFATSILGVGCRFLLSPHAVTTFFCFRRTKLHFRSIECMWLRVSGINDLALFSHCVLQKIKAAHSLLMIEKCKGIMLPNPSRFPQLRRRSSLLASEFLWRWRKYAASTSELNYGKMTGSFSMNWQSSWTELSTVAARTDVSEGLSSILFEMVVRETTMPLLICSGSSWTV